MYIDIYIWKHLEASGAIWKHLESSGGTQETPRRHQEAAKRHRRHPGDTQHAPGGTKSCRGHLEEKCAETILFYSKTLRDRPFCEDGSEVTLTKSAACSQK